ncbi:MAG: peptide deformylase [Gammaproteobacteria bacterium]
MPVQPVIKMGNPLLYQVAKSVTEFNTPELIQLIEDLFNTMRATGGVGIAAPQIGVSYQVTVFGFEKSLRYPHAESVPQTVLINPTVEFLTSQMEDDWEGCLSTPGLRGFVPRYTHIRYSGYDQFGEFFQREVQGFHARLVQHEYDHLQGKLYPMRLKELHHFGFEEEISELMKKHAPHPSE